MIEPARRNGQKSHSANTGLLSHRAHSFVWYGAGRDSAQLATCQRLHTDGASIQAQEFHLVGGTLFMNVHDHTDVTWLQSQSGEWTRENNLSVLLKHRHLLVWLSWVSGDKSNSFGRIVGLPYGADNWRRISPIGRPQLATNNVATAVL